MIIGGERRRGAWGLSSHSGSSAVRSFARWAGDCPALPNIIQRADDGEWTLRGDGMEGREGGLYSLSCTEAFFVERELGEQEGIVLIKTPGDD